MSTLAFRHLDVNPSDPVESWPYEGIVAAIERGSLSDWRRLVRAIRADPWGRIARSVQEYAGYGQEVEAVALLLTAVERARLAARESEVGEAASRVCAAIEQSGLSAKAFAAQCGTSAARLSSYARGRVTPSAALLVRFERRAARDR